MKKAAKKAVLATKKAVKKVKSTAKKAAKTVKKAAKTVVTQTKQNVKATIKDTKKVMTKVGGKVAVAYTSFKEGGYKELLSAGLDFIPIVGNAKALVEAAIGRDPITGRKLETWERGASVAAILGGPLVKGIKHGAKLGAKAISGATSGSKAKNKTVNLAKSPTPTNPPKQQTPSLAKKEASATTATPAKAKEQGKGIGKVDTPVAFKQTEFSSSYINRYNQTPAPNNPTVEFKGVRGESLCTLKPTPDPQIQKILDQAGIEGIQYKNAVPDFSPVSRAQLEINHMVGGTGTNGTKARAINFKQSDQILAEQLNNSPELANSFGMTSGKIKSGDIRDYREEYNLTWHELNDVKTMQLVPSVINSKFGHLGGVGEINAGAFKPGGFADK